MRNDEQFMAGVLPEELTIINNNETPPFLRNFKGKIGERFEENIRILQKIGLINYKEELEKRKEKDYDEFIKNLFTKLTPIDVVRKK